MQLHEQIKSAEQSYRSAKPRSARKAQKHREHVWLVVKLLQKGHRREIRQDKRKS